MGLGNGDPPKEFTCGWGGFQLGSVENSLKLLTGRREESRRSKGRSVKDRSVNVSCVKRIDDNWRVRK